MKFKVRDFLLVAFFFVLSPVFAQSDDPQLADIENDEGGPVLIHGEANYTFPAFGTFFSEPYIVLRDGAYLVDRDIEYEDAEISQVFGKITSDPFESPFTYQLSLPIEPLVAFRDVDNDDRIETGVMILEVQLAQNMLGDPFQEKRDFITGLLSSAIFSEDARDLLEVSGGKLLVYAPDDEQGFPSGFGDDGYLFTEDDPTVLIPQGYTLVDLNTDPFTFDRSREPFVELNEPVQIEANDFRDMSYVEAFDAMIDLFREEYAFTEYKELDWDAISEAFRPRVEDAQAENDPVAFRQAIRDFAWSIPDGHVGAPISNAEFQEAIAGGVGMSIREVDDGRVIVHYVLPGGPAEEEGIQLRAEILEVNGVPIQEALENTIPWSAPFSTPDFERLQQLRYVIRFPLSQEEVEVVYQNPGEDVSSRAVLPIMSERESFNYSSFASGLTGIEPPLEYRILDSGFGYIKIYSFADDLPLTLRLWERALSVMIANEVPGIILDMRQNGGGAAYLADQMPAYFFDEELNLGFSAFYEKEVGDFYYHPEEASRFVLPAEELRYRGSVAVLIHPFCQSACESFVYNLTLQERAAVVGQYTTSGLGGSVVPVFLPGGVTTSITNGRSLDADGEIYIEGKGVAPTVRVPVTVETLFSSGDPVLEAAIAHLSGEVNVPTTAAGDLSIGDTVTGELVPGERLRYRLVIDEDTVLDFLASNEDGRLDTYLRLYVEGSDQVALENDDDPDGRLVFNSALRRVPVPGGLTVIVEVAGYNDEESGEFTLTVQESDLPTVYELASSDSNFTMFIDAVIAADLVDVIIGDEPITVFAPDNDAFDALLGDLGMSAEELLVDHDLLREILSYHILEGEYLSRDLAAEAGESIPTLFEDAEIVISVRRGEVILNGTVSIVGPDISAGNGIIHIVDEVLLPFEDEAGGL